MYLINIFILRIMKSLNVKNCQNKNWPLLIKTLNFYCFFFFIEEKEYPHLQCMHNLDIELATKLYQKTAKSFTELVVFSFIFNTKNVVLCSRWYLTHIQSLNQTWNLSFENVYWQVAPFWKLIQLIKQYVTQAGKWEICLYTMWFLQRNI